MGNILQRKERLEAARGELKKEFVGIDGPIDEIVELVHSWYCFPEGQIRPTVINLVGMTGVGKTSLIERLFQLLELENVYYKFDMGYYASNTENLKHELSKKVRSFDGDPICFVMDEFQLCRSIDGDGEEIDRSNFRPIWDLLDSGKLNLVEPSYGLETLHLLKTKLEHCIENGLTSKGLTITKGEKFFVDLLGVSAYDQEEEFSGTEESTKVPKKPSMVPSEYFYYIQQCVPNRFMGDGELRNYLNSLRDEDSIVNFLSETIEYGGRPKTYDFSSSIIFVIANIDEAYTASKDVDPDMDADALHKHSLDIGIYDVKQCLGKRFRSEQIARLGNNYVIYPSFSSDTYRKLVDLELKKKQEVVKDKFNIDIEFDRSLRKIIYNEGVFPTQGTRPVFTTINYIVGSFIGRMLGHLEENGLMESTSRVEWSFKRNKNHLTFFGKDGPMGEVSYDVKIKVDNLRRAKHNDEQALTSVHEAGHAVVCAALLHLVPSKVMSSSAGGAEGLNIINWKKMKSREYAVNMASVFIAGIEAEKLIFGQENCGVDGASSDMHAVTELVSMAVQHSGVYQPMVSHQNPMVGDSRVLVDDQNRTARKIEEILDSAKKRAINTLTLHKPALIALSLELFRHPVMEKKKVAEVLAANGLEVKEVEDGFYKNTLLALDRSMATSVEKVS